MLREVVALFASPGLLPAIRAMAEAAALLLSHRAHRSSDPHVAVLSAWLQVQRKLVMASPVGLILTPNLTLTLT